MKKNRGYGFGGLLFIFLLFSGCATMEKVFQEPQVSMDSFSITGINFESIDLLFNVKIANPNAYSIPMPNIDWALDVAANPFAQGEIEAGGSIKSRGETLVELPVRLKYQDLYDGVLKLFTESEVAYDIALGFRFPLPLIENKRYELDFSGTIPLLKIPEISFGGIKVRQMGLTKIDLELNVGVLNKNAFSLLVDSFNYDFTVNGSRWSQGRVDEKIEMAAGSGKTIPVNISLNSLTMVRDILDIINGQKSINYSFGGSFAMGSGLPILNDFDLPFALEGTTKIGR